MSFRRKDHSNEHGFTLMELLIAMFLGMIVLGAGYTVFQGSNRAATQQNLDNRMQDNARVAMDVIARSFRRAGFLVNFPAYPVGQPVDANFDGGALTKLVSQNSSTGPDTVTVVGGTLTSVGWLVNSVPGGANTLLLNDAAGIAVGDIIGLGLTYSGRVAAVAGKTITLDTSVPTGATNMAYPGEYLADGVTKSEQNPTPVRLLTRTQYMIDSSNQLHPVLQQRTRGTTEPVAEDIEDIQIAYGVDQNANRIIEPGEWVWNPTAAQLDLIRLVRITIVARSAQPDPALLGRSQNVPAIEDRPAQNDLRDGYRRYILTRVVKARNIDVLFTL